MIAQPAIQEGRHVAATILRLEASLPPEPFRYRDKGIMATIGRNSAVCQIKRLSFKGFIGWVVVRSLAGKAREISPLLWVVAAGFLVYFARGPVEALLAG